MTRFVYFSQNRTPSHFSTISIVNIPTYASRWLGLHKDIMKLVFILRKNLFPVPFIDKCIYRYLNTAIDRYGSTQTSPSSNTTSQSKQHFYKLPNLGRFSAVAQSKIRRLVNRYCNDLDIISVFTTFRLRNLFSVKDSVPIELRSRV